MQSWSCRAVRCVSGVPSLATAFTSSRNFSRIAPSISGPQYSPQPRDFGDHEKADEWRKFCADNESAKESARMSKILKNCNDKKAKRDSVYKPDGTLTETSDETLEIMEKSHFKDDDPPAHTNTSPDKHLSKLSIVNPGCRRPSRLLIRLRQLARTPCNS